MLVYPSSMQVSNRCLQRLSDALRQRRSIVGSRWRRLSPGEQALSVLAYLNKGESYPALAGGFGVGTTTVYRYVHEDVDVLAALAPTLDEALDLGRVNPRRRRTRRATRPCRRIEAATVFSLTLQPASRRSSSSRGEPCRPRASRNAVSTARSIRPRRRSRSVCRPVLAAGRTARAAHL